MSGQLYKISLQWYVTITIMRLESDLTCKV